MEQNLHETTSRWKTYGKQLFPEDLEVQDVMETRDKVVGLWFESPHFFAIR
jgi:hypothetical protein